MKHHSFEIVFAVLLSALSLPAEAHTGHGIAHDFQAGLWHPLLGADHLLVMIGVGLWSGFLGGAERGWLPVTFLAAMAAGAAISFSGITVQGPEIAVGFSVLAIGAILTFGKHAKLGWAAGMAALFACSHGYVHALEAGTDRQALYYTGGFLISTALLLGIGLTLGRLSALHGRWIKTAFGLVCTGVGIGLLLGA